MRIKFYFEALGLPGNIAVIASDVVVLLYSKLFGLCGTYQNLIVSMGVFCFISLHFSSQSHLQTHHYNASHNHL